MDTLILRGNQIEDKGLRYLVDRLKMAHNTTLEELDISETKVTDHGVQAVIEVMDRIKTLHKVHVEELPEVSLAVR